MKAQVSLKMGTNSKHIARALMDEAKDGLPKVKVEVIPAGEKVKIEINAEDFTSLRAANQNELLACIKPTDWLWLFWLE